VKIEDLKSDMAEMFGITIEELGDPFDGYRPFLLPKPVKYKCSVCGEWWYPDDQIECNCRMK
jgi:hypothetical protein